MKLSIKNPIIFARLLLVVAIVIVLFYIILCFIFNTHGPRCDMFCEIDKTAKNSNSENAIGLSLANLSANEEKEIQKIIKKAFEGEWNYYYNRDEDRLDKFMRDLYIPEEYQRFKEEMKKRSSYTVPENLTKEDIIYFIKNIKFSKPRKYQNLNDRIGMVGGDYSFYHYFLFKKVNNQWKIEKEKWPVIKDFFNEELIIKEIIKQKNNETDYSEEIDYPTKQ